VVAQVRTQARRRLTGAAVLLLLGVLLFPLLFEIQPRPLPMDLPIIVAPGKGAAAPAATAERTARPAPPLIIETAEPETRPSATEAPATPVTLATPVAAAAAAAPAASAPASTQPAATRAANAAVMPVTAPDPSPAPSPAPAPKVSAKTPPPEAPKASALAVTAAPEAAGRFVVQVGAFADDATVRQTRQKVEKLGLKTYTQEVSTDGGKRVRVRVGPFASRDEAAQVLNKLKVSGLPGAVLAL
jgi:DedD protein